MNIKNNKKGFVLLTTSLVAIFIVMSIATYYRFSSDIISLEFHKDLAKIRGYWAAYGAKELEDEPSYKYYKLRNDIFLYEIATAKDITRVPFLGYVTNAKYDWNIINTSNSGIKDDMVYHRTLKPFINLALEIDTNKTKSYLK